MRQFITCIVALSLVLIAIPVWAGSYQYITPVDLKQKIEKKAPMHLVDIQVEEEYTNHHIVGALDTYAYPVKSDSDKAKLDGIMAQVLPGTDPVVIVCPRGGGGAKRTYDYLSNKGVATERLFILDKGQGGWPYPELLDKTM